MKTWNLSCEVTVSAFTSVEAETLKEAMEIADGREVELHFNGSGTFPEESWLIEEGDGQPTRVHESGK